MVVSILGIIVAIVVPNVHSFFGTGRVQAADAELHNVQTAVMAYMTDNSGDLPTADGNPGAIDNSIDTYLLGGIVEVGYGAYSVALSGEVSTSWTP